MHFGKNTSHPNLSPTFIKRSYKSPHRMMDFSETRIDMEEIQQEQYYIQKLRQQRQRMQLFKEEFQKKDEKIAHLQQQLSHLKSHNQETKHLQRIQQLQHQVLSLSKQRQDSVLNSHALKSQLFSLREELQNMTEYLYEKDNEIEQMRFKLEKEYQLSRELREHVNCVYKQHSWEMKELEKEMSGCKRRGQDVRKELETLRRENEEIRGKNSEFQFELEKRRHHVDALVLENGRLKEEVEIDKEQFDKVVGSLNSYKSVAELRQNQYANNMESNLRRAEQKIHKLSKINKVYKSKIKEHDECVKQYIQDTKQLKLKNHNLSQEYRKQQQLVLNYTIVERKYLEDIDRLKREGRQREKEREKGRGEGDGHLRAELERLRHELYVLRSAEVEKMEKVFRSFDGEKRH